MVVPFLRSRAFCRISFLFLVLTTVPGALLSTCPDSTSTWSPPLQSRQSRSLASSRPLLSSLPSTSQRHTLTYQCVLICAGTSPFLTTISSVFDDIVVWHRDRDTLLVQMQQVMCFLQDMGFRLNLAKSHPYPSLAAVWLGVHWLPQSGHWHLPVDRQANIRDMALALLQAPTVTRRQLEWLVGLINFACQVHKYLRPFLQPLTRSCTFARADMSHRP